MTAMSKRFSSFFNAPYYYGWRILCCRSVLAYRDPRKSLLEAVS